MAGNSYLLIGLGSFEAVEGIFIERGKGLMMSTTFGAVLIPFIIALFLLIHL